MRRLALAALLALSAVPAPAQEAPPQLSLEQQTLLRCSAAFAIVASEQARGVESALGYPPLGERGREYFVRASARLMDDLSLTREQVAALLKAEVERLQGLAIEAEEPAQLVDSIMQPCLLSLTASGL